MCGYVEVDGEGREWKDRECGWCFGIPYAPTSSWYCSRCRLEARGASEAGDGREAEAGEGTGLKLGERGGLEGKRGG